VYLCPSVREWPNYTLRHRVPFSSPPTTRRATVELFYPASTWRNNNNNKKNNSTKSTEDMVLRKQTEFYYICLFTITDPTFLITQTIVNHCICLRNTLCAFHFEASVTALMT
jgi:hypothetical protein